MSDHHGEIVIIKKKVYHGGGHHGGAWKIAFADFMTAMMAFFLVLWIINATDKDTKTVIARYFNPVKLENPSRAKKGIHGVDASKAPQDDTKGDPNPEKGQTSSGDKPDKGTGPAEAASTGVPPKKDENPKTPAAVPHPESQDAVDVKPTMSETALFSDPFETLDKIVGGNSSDSAAASPNTGTGEPTREAGANSIEAFRDPFKPIGPGAQSDPASMESDVPPPPMPDQKPDLEPQKGEKPPSDLPNAARVAPKAPPNPAAGPQPAAVAAKDAGTAPAKDAAAPPHPPIAEPSPGAQSNAPIAAKTAELVKQLQQQLAPFETSLAGPAIQIEATKEGLLISLTDRLSFSMFAIGSAEPRAEVIKAMEKIAGVVKTHNESIVVRGHTDGRPYKGGLYDNWRLSSARAQMAYYMLTRAGVPEARIQSVEGHADRALRDPAHPLAAENRRIEILLREAKP